MTSDYPKDKIDFHKLRVASVRIAQDPHAPNAVCTARLEGVEQEFVFDGSSEHSIGFTWECEGMDYPVKPWPKGGSVSFSGPVIDAMFNSKHVSLKCDENGCDPRDIMGRSLSGRIPRNYLREEFDAIIAIMDRGSHSDVVGARKRTSELLKSQLHVCNR